MSFFSMFNLCAMGAVALFGFSSAFTTAELISGETSDIRQAKIQPLIPGEIKIYTDGSVEYPMEVLFDVEAHWSGVLVAAHENTIICRGGSFQKEGDRPALYQASQAPVRFKDIKWMIGPDCPSVLPEGAHFAFAWDPKNEEFATSSAIGVVTKKDDN